MRIIFLHLRMMHIGTCMLLLCLASGCSSTIMFAQKEQALEKWGGKPKVTSNADGSKTYRYRRLVATGTSMSGVNGVVSGPAQKLEIFCDHYVEVNATGEIVTNFAMGTKSVSNSIGFIEKPTLEEPYSGVNCQERLP